MCGYGNPTTGYPQVPGGVQARRRRANHMCSQLTLSRNLQYGSSMNHRAVVLVLISAALFGVSTPAAKALVGAVHPAVLAGLLYCGAGVGIAIVRRFGHVTRAGTLATQAALTRSDLPWLFGAILAGGIVGPILLMLGLAHTDAAAAALLLTLEGVATALLAWFVFGEGFDRRIAIGMACLVAGAIVIAWSGAPTLTGIIGPLAVFGACVAWALDNNLTRKVSLADPLQIVEVKGLIAGPVNILLGLWAGGALPSVSTAATAGLVGFLGYGISLALFVYALRHLGAARTGAYFSLSPFIGAAGAVLVLGESLTAQLLVGGMLMGLGLWLHATEDHEHQHEHEAIEHEHSHVHDEHHGHDHEKGPSPQAAHNHWHSHARHIHTHPHLPEMHHTHRH